MNFHYCYTPISSESENYCWSTGDRKSEVLTENFSVVIYFLIDLYFFLKKQILTENYHQKTLKIQIKDYFEYKHRVEHKWNLIGVNENCWMFNKRLSRSTWKLPHYVKLCFIFEKIYGKSPQWSICGKKVIEITWLLLKLSISKWV